LNLLAYRALRLKEGILVGSGRYAQSDLVELSSGCVFAAYHLDRIEIGRGLSTHQHVSIRELRLDKVTDARIVQRHGLATRLTGQAFH